MKQYANDWTKEASRQLLKQTIASTLLTFKRPQDLTVLHLPGPNGQEYKSVYGPLEIPPQNVIGIEQDATNAHLAQQHNPETTVLHTSLKQYLDDHPVIDQDIVSIDSTSNISLQTAELLEQLNRSIANRNVVIHLAVCARREANDSKDFLRAATKHFTAHYDALNTSKSSPPQELGEQRDSFLKLILRNAVCDLSLEQKLKIHEQATGMTKQDCATICDIVRKANPSYHDLCDEALLSAIAPTFTQTALEELQQRVAPLVHLKNRETKTFNQAVRDVAAIVYVALHDYEAGQHRITQSLKRYAYISESGTPMIGDIAYIRSFPAMYTAARQIVQGLGNNAKSIHDRDQLCNGINTYLRLYERNGGPQEEALTNQPRVYLGSSTRPILRYAQAIKLLADGKTPQELSLEYRGMSVRQLSAYKAHITMGTYTRQADPEIDAVLRTDIQDRSDLANETTNFPDTTLTREDALQYLRAEITPEEINTAYNGNTVSQLHAWNHWLKQGKYEVE